MLYLWLVHLLVLLASWLAPVPLWLSAILTAAVVASFYCSFQVYRNTPQMIASGESWLLRQRNGTEHGIELCAPCYISRWLTVVPVKGKLVRRYLVIPRDSLSGDNYRRLGVQLRISYH
ncbi:MAG: hypothetical protein OIF34_06380 [Porticoccaceae bacterium]|nr:hypothetical protein [Porticoccaceae bacterium]